MGRFSFPTPQFRIGLWGRPENGVTCVLLHSATRWPVFSEWFGFSTMLLGFECFKVYFLNPPRRTFKQCPDCVDTFI